MERDLVIVGGGPVGCCAAAVSSKKVRTTILEEHHDAGTPVQCAGLVTPRVVEMVSAQSSVLNRISGCRIHFPGGGVISLDGKEEKAAVVDRCRFDRICKDRAIKAGAEYLADAKFLDFEVVDGKAVVWCDGRPNIEAEVIIGADGYKSNVAKKVNLPEPKDSVRGIEYDIDHRMDDQTAVDVYLGNKVSPGFFAWKIPCGGFTRIGLCVSEQKGTPNQYLTRLLEREGLAKARRLETYSGVIPLGTRERTFADRVMVVGDAAAMAKPLSGGGLYTGMTAAECAAETAMEAIEDNDPSARRLSSYEKRWKERIGRELDRGYRVRKVFVRLSDRKFDQVCELMSRPDVRKILESGDIDYPTKLAPAILRSVPTLLRFSPQILGSLLFK